MLGKPVEQMKYQPLGNLVIEFPGHASRERLSPRNSTSKRRSRAFPIVSGGVHFRREVFASPVDQVIVVRLTADKPGSISLLAKLDGVTNTKTPGDERHTTDVLGPGRLLLRGKTGSMLGIEGRGSATRRRSAS